MFRMDERGSSCTVYLFVSDRPYQRCFKFECRMYDECHQFSPWCHSLYCGREPISELQSDSHVHIIEGSIWLGPTPSTSVREILLLDHKDIRYYPCWDSTFHNIYFYSFKERYMICDFASYSFIVRIRMRGLRLKYWTPFKWRPDCRSTIVR